MADTPPISVQDQADETPQGLAALWGKELSAARETLKAWWERGEKIVKRYLDEREKNEDCVRLNLFTSNTQNMEALLFGKTPEVDVARRYADAQDDQARVASEALERILNADIDNDDDTQQESLRHALGDRLRVGFGSVWLRYEVGETQKVPGQPAIDGAPEVPEQELRPNEKVPVDYSYWMSELWSPCRVYADLRWRARYAELAEEPFVKRFGEEKREVWTANRKNPTNANDATKVKDPLDRCVVWEIWSKEKKHVYWHVEGASAILDDKPDPLGLAGFWPSPQPMFANLTTSKLIPTPDFVLAEDLYDACDELFERIALLRGALRVAGVYDKNSDEIKRLVSETAQNELIGVDAWAAFAEKGGVKGAIDWLPIDQVAATIQILNQELTIQIGLLYQITGMSDIMRGQAAEQATATEQAIKARFASVRVQTLQDEFARFASDTQKIKAEIISKHFDPQTIIDRSNIMRTPDAQLAEGAVALIKQPDFQFRVSVNPDSVSLQDFAALKQERFEFGTMLSGFVQGMLPMIQMLGVVPGGAAAAVKFTLTMGQAMTAGLKGSNEMEGIFDAFVAELQQASQQPTPPPPPDPKVEAAKVKAGAEQFKAKADMAQTGMDLQVKQQEHGMKMREIHAGILSEEAKARAEGMKKVNEVTETGPT